MLVCVRSHKDAPKPMCPIRTSMCFVVFLPFPQQSHVPGSAPANGRQCPETCEMFGCNGLHVVYFNCCGSNAPLLFSQKIATCQDSCNSKPPSPQFPACLNCQVCLPSPEFLAGRRQEHPLPACLLPVPTIENLGCLMGYVWRVAGNRYV